MISLKRIVSVAVFFLVVLPLAGKYEVFFTLYQTMIEGGKDPVAVADGKTYDDELMQIVWTPTPNGFGFNLFNKTNASMSIIWDECAIITMSGTSERIIHAGIKLINASESMPPTIVPMQARVSDLFYPAGSAYFVSGRYGGWRQPPIYKDVYKDKDFEKIRGVPFTMRTILVLQLPDGTKKMYHFFFKGDSRLKQK